MRYKKGEIIKVNYIVLKRTTGLTDVLMHVYNQEGIEIDNSPFVMTELVGAGGLYYASFTPDEIGQWRIRIQSATNGDDISKVFEVQLTKEDDIKAQTQSIEDKINAITIIIDATKEVVDNIEDKVDIVNGNVNAIKVKTDNLPVDTAGKLDTIESKIDNIDAQISVGGYFL